MTSLASSTPLSISGAIAFLLWAALHIAGSGYVLVLLGSGGPAAGFSVYGATTLPSEPIAGAVLGYMSLLIAFSGLVVGAIALRLNWPNSQVGLTVNTGVVLVIEAGLLIFLVFPGHVSFAEAIPGLILFLTGATLGGLACRRNDAHGT